MENDVTSRVEQLLTEWNMTASAFADGVQIPRAVMSHILSRRNKPSLEVVQKISKKFPQISTDWLLNGIGNMIQLNIFEDETLRTVPEEANTEKDLTKIKENSVAQKIIAADAPASSYVDSNKDTMPTDASSSHIEYSKPIEPQSKTPVEPTAPPIPLAEKKIAKIIFFYTDNSFSVHLPE